MEFVKCISGLKTTISVSTNTYLLIHLFSNLKRIVHLDLKAMPTSMLTNIKYLSYHYHQKS